MVATCSSDNTIAVDQSSFWSNGTLHWDKHRIGWAIAGGCAALTTLITLITVSMHARNYRVPAEQRQIIRVLYLPMVYGIISFLSYRFFRDYTYYSLIEVAYEALSIAAFLLLLIQYVADTSSDATAEAALARKEKQKLPLPFCCWRYRPTKPYFMYTLKWSVLQYAFVRPIVSIVAIICQAYNVLCDDQWSIHFANVYLEAVDFVSISVALYGLVLFYVLTKEELQGRRPLAKFSCIKLIVFFTYYQGFVFDLLQKKGAIKGTEYWSQANIVDGLSALATTIEMVIFAGLMMWAYPASEYYPEDLGPRRSAFKAIWDSINYADFVLEIYTSTKFFINFLRGRPETRAQMDMDEKGRIDFDKAFRLNYGRTQMGSEDGLFSRNKSSTIGMAGANGEEQYVTAPGSGRRGRDIPMRDLEARR